MNWFDKRSGPRLPAQPGAQMAPMALMAFIALAGVSLCPLHAYADEGKKDSKQEEAGKSDEGKNDGKTGKKKKKKKKEPDVADIVPIPIGHGAEGIKVPQHDEHGRLQMTFEIGSAFRQDELNLKMENLKIETFDALGNLDMVVEMPKSVMNMKTRVLTSADPVQIERTDFKITGGNATFDTRTRFGTFKGPVRMLIYNRTL